MSETLENPIDVKKLSPEAKKALMAELAAEQEAEKNAKLEQREAYKKLVEETVPEVLFKMLVASEQLTNAKTEAFRYFENVLKMKTDLYGLKKGQQSHTFSCEMGEITLGYRVNEGWDDTAGAGIEKVENYIVNKYGKDNDVVNWLFTLLKKDAKGNLKASRVLELKKFAEESKAAEFIDGVEIIAGAYKPIRSVWFLEASINKDGKKQNIPLNISSVDFMAGYKFEYMSDESKIEDNVGSN